MADYDSVNAHHIIPLGVFDKLDENMRIHFHDIFGSLQKEDNFMFLFTKKGNADKVKALRNPANYLGDFPLGSSRHGFHNGYDIAVEERIKDILTSPASDDAKRLMVLDLQTGLRDMLIAGEPELVSGGAGTVSNDANKIGEHLDKQNLLNPADFDGNGKLINQAKYKRYSAAESADTVHSKAIVHDDIDLTTDHSYDRKARDLDSTSKLTKKYLKEFRQKIIKLNDVVPFLKPGTI